MNSTHRAKDDRAADGQPAARRGGLACGDGGSSCAVTANTLCVTN